MIVTHAQAESIAALAERADEQKVTVTRMPWDEYLSVRRYNATQPVRVYTDGRMIIDNADKAGLTDEEYREYLGTHLGSLDDDPHDMHAPYPRGNT